MIPDVGIAETSRSRSRKARGAGRWTALMAAAAGALAGFAAASLVGRPAATLDAREAPSLVGRPAATLDAREAPAPRTPSEWMSMARRLRAPASDRALQAALAQSLASDTTLFRAIVEDYGRTEERRFRATLRELIVASARADLVAAGTELTREARGLQRGAGFELLARLRPTPERYTMVMRAAFEETDPTALAGALMALRSPDLPSNADARQLVPRFLVLAHHPDALVRGHAIQQLADWDKPGRQATAIVLDALADTDRLVREAAVGAVMIGGLRSGGLKGALLRISGNPGEDLTIRGSALQALERFALTDAEQARYRADRDELERLAMTHKADNHTQER